MNQILSTKIKRNNRKYFFKIQFFISCIIFCILIGLIFNYIISIQKKEKLSNNILGNYNIYRLYANNSKTSEINATEENAIFGIIEIPKINIYYPVFSNLSDDLLKISPCRFYGNSPKNFGNICIAGHNYNNSMFFSNISLLKKGDMIYLYDNLGHKYEYSVFDIYEVNESDLSPIFDYKKNFKQLTLITCNNINNNRIIVKSRQQ